MSTFDDLIVPTPPSNKPALHPATGTRDDLLNTVLYEHVKGENNKPHFNVKFRGLVLYTTILDYKTFEAKYDKTFIDYCTGTSPKATMLASKKTEQMSNFKVIEAIVYIQELCACLPQPQTSEFFRQMKKMSEKPKPGQETKKLKDNEKGSKLSAKQLEQIRRYPRAYLILRDGLKETKPQDIVEIAFPYNFDYSYGTIVNQAPV